MYKIEQAELKDVDMLLDMKLDIIFNSEEVFNMDKNEMEKIVNYTEEEIRENISNYKFVYKENDMVGAYALNNYEDGKIIDLIYVLPNYRASKIATWIISEIINTNYKPLYAFVDKNNNIAVDFLSKNNFSVIENLQYKYLMKNDNVKETNNDIKLSMFKSEVSELASKYGIEYTLNCCKNFVEEK